MSEKNINVVFLFDARYLGPALVSASSFFEVPGMFEFPVTLVYIATDSATDSAVSQVLQLFKRSIQIKYPQVDLRLIVLQGNQFSDYVQRYHFSSAILYKAALPIILPTYENILFFDCGMIFGLQVGDFIRTLKMDIQNGEMSAVGAYCVSPYIDGALNLALQSHPHHVLYPTAAVLYFDVNRYNELSIYARYLAAYATYRNQLLYAEQDLLCLVLNEGELGAFSTKESKCHIDMASPASWNEVALYEENYVSRDFLYLKHIGSFKPWKKWVLHPAKSIYLRELCKVEKLIGIGEIPVLRDSELFPANSGFLAQELVRLENYCGLGR
jgi:lipopolysaccharide biosynthesis glycosyltransferase